jgi:FkbM family methyltransferase
MSYWLNQIIFIPPFYNNMSNNEFLLLIGGFMRAAPSFLMDIPIVKKAIRGIWKRLHWLMHGRFFVDRRKGLDLLLDLHNSMDKYIVAFDRHEDEQIDHLFSAAKDFIDKGEPVVFLDVGAHWGLYALLAWKSRLFTKIIAIEADSRNACQLEANLFLNACGEEIQVIKGVASDRTGKVDFLETGSRDRSTMRVLDQKGDDAYSHRARSVRAFRIEDEVSLLNSVLIVKIDVEGYELAVIKGMENLLRNNRCLLQVEVFDPSLKEFMRTMESLGYQLKKEIGPDRYFQNI